MGIAACVCYLFDSLVSVYLFDFTTICQCLIIAFVYRCSFKFRFSLVCFFLIRANLYLIGLFFGLYFTFYLLFNYCFVVTISALDCLEWKDSSQNHLLCVEWDAKL